jgi:hypothetical protein
MINDESSEFQFFSIGELPELIAYKHREAIHDFVNRFCSINN